MNPIDDLRAARPAHLAASTPDERTRETELAHAFAQGEPAEPRRAPARGRRGWALGLAVAAAAATAVVVTGGLPGGTAPQPVPTAASGGTATPSGPPAPVELSARDVLLVAATSAEKQPPASGTYWHTEFLQRTLYRASAGYLVAEETRIRTWVSARGHWSVTQPLGVQPASEADRAKWQEAGAPTEIEVAVPGKGTITLSTAPGKPSPGHAAGEEIFWLGRNVTMADLRALPDDPDGLKKWLLRYYAGHDTESDRPMGQDAWLFQTTAGLITDMPVSARVRAAAFRMLAALPSVTATGQVTDARGRAGTAVAIETDSIARTGERGVLQDRLIIDEAAGAALARESVVVTPGGLQKDFEAGAVWNSVTQIQRGWTDTRDS
ncbi:CU044_5270 family protein [Nonomuraea sp. NPDC050328]|uniref:CU044_5270 family protein n=1 Tax=Nonomuraea sp. NPDC050328 TaxID=3364361 RepID=UPI0037A34F58